MAARKLASLMAGLALALGAQGNAAAESADDNQPAPAPTPAPAEAGDRWFIPPIRWWGSSTYDLRHEGGGGGPAVDSRLVSTQLSAATFLWQPWFAQVTGGLGLVTSSVESGESQRGNTLTGNGRLQLLPLSRFPFEAWFDRNDSRTDSRGEAVLFGSQYVSTRWGLTQRYSPPAGDMHYLASYEHAGRTQALGGEDSFDALQMDLTGQRDAHSYQVNGRMTRNESSDGLLDNDFKGVVGRHAWRPDERLSVETLANLSWTGGEVAGAPLDSRFMQLNSFAVWRPDEQWLVSGGAHLFDLLTDTGGTSAQAGSLAFNGGATYQWTRHTRFNGTVSLSRNTTDAGDSLASSQNLGLSHQPDPVPLGGYTYQWFTSAGVGNRTGPDASRHLNAQVAHSLDRSFELSPGTAFSLGFQQNLSGDADTRASHVTRLSHNASATWSRGQEGGNAYVRLSVGDSRNLGGTREVFQLLNLQASLSRASGGRASWNGNLTLQATRQVTQDVPDGGFDLSGSGDLTYMNTRFFGINRLRFTSQFKVNDTRFSDRNSGQLEPVSRNRESQSWDNRLEYAIGRTTLSAGLRYARVEGEARYLLMLKLTRYFGDL